MKSESVVPLFMKNVGDPSAGLGNVYVDPAELAQREKFLPPDMRFKGLERDLRDAYLGLDLLSEALEPWTMPKAEGAFDQLMIIASRSNARAQLREVIEQLHERIHQDRRVTIKEAARHMLGFAIHEARMRGV